VLFVKWKGEVFLLANLGRPWRWERLDILEEIFLEEKIFLEEECRKKWKNGEFGGKERKERK